VKGNRTDSNENASVRIRTERLDRLVDMVGELVIAHSMVRQDPTLNRGDHMDLTRKVAHAGKIVRELQELAMSLRMVPLKPTFQKLARVVRDTAQKSGKSVDLVVAGEDTEIDRNMVDVIADPLIHMLRNGVDHGIETPDDRLSRGKPRAGTIRLTASHSGGNVIVELCDDGAGLDRARIVKKAIERGLIESDAQMSDSDVFNLIFEPGFSTRDQVTDVSGRGVGMDVVRRNVQQLNGRVDISSVLGAGTTFTLRLPLTLAVTDGMLVRVGSERFIVPTVNIQTSLRPVAENLSTVSQKGELLFIRGELIPMFRLHRLFDLAGATEDPTRALAVVVNGVEGRCALLVDELLGQQQVVAKSLGDGIGNVRGIAGGAILGDGRVGLILDTPEIIALAREHASRLPDVFFN
jgi:two-component system, chemotaxis family, sensor kinase CheA